MFPKLLSCAQKTNAVPAFFHFKWQFDFSFKQNLDQPLSNDPKGELDFLPCPEQSDCAASFSTREKCNWPHCFQAVNSKLHSDS